MALLLAALPIHAGGPLRPTFSFDEKSRDALVIVEVVPQKIVEEWQIPLNLYSFETKNFAGSLFTPISLLQLVESQQEAPRYFAGIVKRAGSHVLYGLLTQQFWGACFDQGAPAFTFEPGKVYYLGALDPNKPLARISRELPDRAKGPVWVLGMSASYTPPSQSAGWEKDVAGFLAEHLPKVKAPVLAAEGIEVSFTPGKTSAGNSICRAI